MIDETAERRGVGGVAEPTDAVVAGEVRDFLRTHEQRRRQLPRAIVVGILAGLLAVAFTRLLESADALRTTLILHARTAGGGWIVVPVLVGSLTGGVAVWLVRRFAPETSGSGIPHLKAVLHHLWTMRGWRIVGVKFAAGAIGIGGGFALGREGPTVQMGGAIGQVVSGWFRVTPRERQTLIAAGSGAGLAAAFNAPLSGLVFVLEELQRDFAPAVFTSTLIAAVTADVVMRLLNGQLPVLHVEVDAIPPLPALPVSIVVGLVAGLLGVVFNRSLVGSLDLFERLRRWPSWAGGAIAGALVGAIGWFAPHALGGGYPLIDRAFLGADGIPTLVGLFLLRFVLTMASYGCGAAGGIFAPLLVLGAELGLAVSLVARPLVPSAVGQLQTFAVVGMAAYFAAIVRAPLTAVVLMVEMTGNYSLVLPLVAACLTAYGLADALGDRPVYEALLERDLRRGRAGAPPADEPLLVELTIAAGAPFDGVRVRDLGLSPGCVLVSVQRQDGELVPTADFRLQGGDRVVAVVAPVAVEAAALLRRGAGAR